MAVVKQLKQHKLLMDTHIWIGLMVGDPRLMPGFRSAADRGQKTGALFLSPISIWELGMLVSNKRLELEMDCRDWVEQSLSSGIQLAPISPRIALHSCQLPGKIHGDPVDRLLVATAYELSAVLVTCDKKLVDYGKERFISTHNPCRY